MSTDIDRLVHYIFLKTQNLGIYDHTMTMSSSPAASTRTRVHIHPIDACGSILTRNARALVNIR